MNEKIKEEMLKLSKDGRLPCSAARSLAEEFELPYREVGKLADALGIKIKDCQLGCF